MFLPEGTTLTEFIVALGAVHLTAAKKDIILPSLKSPPNGANPKAVDKYWKEYVTKYDSIWKKYKGDAERQWACCVAIWVNYCLKRKIQPFDANASTVTQETQDKLVDRTASARSTQLNAVHSLISKGTKKGAISKVLKETFVSIEEPKPGEFVITTKRIVVLDKGLDFNSTPFRNFMDKCSFQRKAGKYIRPTKTNTDVILQMDEEVERPVLILRNKITQAYAEMLLGIKEKSTSREAVKKALTKYWKSLIRDVI